MMMMMMMMMMSIYWAEAYMLPKKTDALVVAGKETGLEVNADKDLQQFLRKEGTIQKLGKKASKFCAGRNYEQTEVKECLLSFSAESPVFQFATQKY
jgi:hypothetical protein